MSQAMKVYMVRRNMLGIETDLIILKMKKLDFVFSRNLFCFVLLFLIVHTKVSCFEKVTTFKSGNNLT
ncbi:hypothetical protein IHE44_0000762 [Lamprotornis superbus]|uniref:Uncharacterized protein n=1 Tax=Lamprotornis superbus TaxID=245042 RepID=A0A835NZB4_9PASS|nr:hypothetical protein IHE44_0000762 [Lamprotornis superbus]